MPDVLGTLREEHASMGKVLDALERQLERAEEGLPFERDTLAEIVDYCLAYPAQMHHRKEDLVVARLRTRDAAAAAAAGDLESEHERLVDLTARFSSAAQRLIKTPDTQPGQLPDLARTFVNAYRSHIEAEERYLFPAALWSLSARDWKDIERQIRALEAPAAEAPAATRSRKTGARRTKG